MKIESTSIGLNCESSNGKQEGKIYNPNDTYQHKQLVKIHQTDEAYFMEEPSKIGFRLVPISKQDAELAIENLTNQLKFTGYTK